jgi:pimeloyl-ACP methyl ester carboxylesterase
VSRRAALLTGVAALAAVWSGTSFAADDSTAAYARRAAAAKGLSCNTTRAQDIAAGRVFGRAFEQDIVTIECDDGYRLAADFVRRRKLRDPMPGILFLHDLGGDRRNWFALAQQLAGRGYPVLIPDLRGHGETATLEGNPPRTAGEPTAKELAAMLSDVRNALGYLAIRGEVNGGRLAVVGAGLGGDLALLVAAQPWASAVRCAVAVSPALESGGWRPADALADIPASKAILLAYGTQDADAAAAVAAFLPLLKAGHDVQTYDSPEKGVRLFAAGLSRRVPDWLIGVLQRPEGGS